jgi:saccharopine dehydrogenase-like NADP-dependent oxidoreductase
MKVVVLGGYGNFGARICRALAGNPGIELVVAGRNIDKARALAQQLGAQAAALDGADPRLADALRESGVGLVIHTAGPFQGQDYHVASSAARAGCHYIDLADGRRFVCDFGSRVGDAFKSAGRSGISGASTVPALSSAVVQEALPKFSQLESIDVCIAPAQRAPRGAATLEAVLSYCGAPIQVWCEGRWQALHGWADPALVRFARLKARRGALCDIPDLELFPMRLAGVQSVMFRAALEVGLTQSLFAMLAALRRSGVLAAPERLAALLHRCGSWVDWLGTPDGGMVVRLRGRGLNGEPLGLAWKITAPNHHGPEIPCMAAIVLARRLAGGATLPVGAMPCMGLISLQDFTPEFERWGMHTSWTEEVAA